MPNGINSVERVLRAFAGAGILLFLLSGGQACAAEWPLTLSRSDIGAIPAGQGMAFFKEFGKTRRACKAAAT